jgi:hypothetical protein
MKTLITAATVLVATITLASAELIPGADVTLGAERSLEAETNALYGSVGLGAITVGATLEDTADDSGSFNISKYEVDSEHTIAGVTLYMNNDFDDGFKHSETVVGGKIKF